MGVISSSNSRSPVWTNQLKDSVWVWMRFWRGRTSGMWEKFSRRGASSNRLADSAKAIQDSSKRAWWGADTRKRSISGSGAPSTDRDEDPPGSQQTRGNSIRHGRMLASAQPQEARTMPSSRSALIAEAIVTFLFFFVGAGSIVLGDYLVASGGAGVGPLEGAPGR